MIIFHTPVGSLKLLNEAPLLDLVNSTDRQRGKAIDFLTGANLSEWAQLTLLADEPLVSALAERNQMAEAAADARHVRELAIPALSDKRGADPALAELLNAWLPQPLTQGHPELRLATSGDSRAQFRANLAFAAASLLLGPERRLIKLCPAEGCTWFYLDRSGGRRSWCTMEGCGNAEKARRHRRRLGS